MAKLRLRPYGARDKPSPIIGKGGKPFVEGALKQQGLERQQILVIGIFLKSLNGIIHCLIE